MKKGILTTVFCLIFPILFIAQDITWPVKAVANRGKLYPVNAYFEDGTILPVSAILKEGDAHFMDVKIVKGEEIVSVKLILSSEYYVPVKGILPDGTLVNIMAEGDEGVKMEVKGVSRDGNTVKIAALTAEENFIPLMAVSPEGTTREVRGVKFVLDNVEMEIGEVQVVAHVKAIPNVDVTGVDPTWFVKALNADGEDLEVVAITKTGKEYPVRALMDGNSAHLLNVRASLSSVDVMIKLMKDKKGLWVLGADEYGRKFDIRAKAADGSLLELVGGELQGNTIPIKAKASDGTLLPVKAFSSEGHVFDIKGIKITNDEVEGIIEGISEWIRYYAHIKAIAPIN